MKSLSIIIPISLDVAPRLVPHDYDPENRTTSIMAQNEMVSVDIEMTEEALRDLWHAIARRLASAHVASEKVAP